MSPRAKGVLARALVVLVVLLVACASTVITAHAGALPTSRLTSDGKFDYTERALAFTPWWGHFNDPTLDSLLQGVGTEAEAATGASVAAEYVKAKVLDYRLAAYREIVKVTDLELTGITQSTGGPADAVQTMLLERRGESTRSAAELERSLDDCIGVLAQQARVSPTRLRTVLADDRLRGLPHFDMQVPARLPANIVRSRPDVERAEAVLLLGMARASRERPLLRPRCSKVGSSPPSRQSTRGRTWLAMARRRLIDPQPGGDGQRSVPRRRGKFSRIRVLKSPWRSGASSLSTAASFERGACSTYAMSSCRLPKRFARWRQAPNSRFGSATYDSSST